MSLLPVALGFAAYEALDSSSSPAPGAVLGPQVDAIEALDLVGDQTHGIKGVAYHIYHRFPFVEFTSGRRSISDQARAMSEDVVRSGDVDWVQKVYLKNAAGNLVSPVAQALQGWLDANGISDQQTVEQGFFTVLDSMASQVGTLSAHLSGEAFDIAPSSCAGHEQEVIDALRSFPGKTLVNEDGVAVYHHQLRGTQAV